MATKVWFAKKIKEGGFRDAFAGEILGGRGATPAAPAPEGGSVQRRAGSAKAAAKGAGSAAGATRPPLLLALASNGWRVAILALVLGVATVLAFSTISGVGVDGVGAASGAGFGGGGAEARCRRRRGGPVSRADGPRRLRQRRKRRRYRGRCRGGCRHCSLQRPLSARRRPPLPKDIYGRTADHFSGWSLSLALSRELWIGRVLRTSDARP